MSDEAGTAPVIERSYSVPQVVKMTGIPATTIRVAIRAGELPAFSVTGGPHGTRVRHSALEAWLSAAYERDGNRAGRGRALSDDEERELLAEWRAGATKAQVARSRGVSERTVQRWIYDAMAREAWGLI